MDGIQTGQPEDNGDSHGTPEASRTHPSLAPAPLHAGKSDHDSAASATASARRLRWRDAEQAAAQLTTSELDTLLMLIGVPFAPVMLLEQLGGLRGGAAVYRRTARLRTMGLVAELRPPVQPRYSPGLLCIRPPSAKIVVAVI